MESWVFLLVGSVGAAGAAMTLGTLAALVQFRRTGRLPGQEDEAAEPAPGAERRLWIRILLGLVVAVVAFTVLADQGLVAGPLLG